MKNKQSDYSYDCKFEYEGETINVLVKSDNKPIRMVRGKEMISGFFEFFNSHGDNIGSTAFYEDFEDMSPVKPSIAKKYYINHSNNKASIKA